MDVERLQEALKGGGSCPLSIPPHLLRLALLSFQGGWFRGPGPGAAWGECFPGSHPPPPPQGRGALWAAPSRPALALCRPPASGLGEGSRGSSCGGPSLSPTRSGDESWTRRPPPSQTSSFLHQATRTLGVGVGEKVKDFEKRGKKEVCPVLDQFLCHVAKTGETMIQWSQFKGYFIFKLEKVMDDFRTSAPEPRGPPNPNVEYIPFDEMKERILKIVTGFNGIPFTIQRLCELLTDPRRNYTGTDKFLRGVEKNVMVVSCVYPSSEKNNSSSLNRMNGVMFPGNSPSYTERSNINGPGTPRPLNRPKVSLSAPMTTNGLPESTDSKEANLQQNEEKSHSDSSTSESEVSSVSPLKNKHPDEDAVEAEGHEVKRLRFDKEGEVRETASQTTSSEISSAVVGETETSSSSQDKDKDSRCTRQHCTEEDEEEDEEEEEESFMTSREMIPERKNQEKESDDALTVNEETSEENNQMEESDVSQAEKDLLHSEGSENEGPVSNDSSDCHETEELVGSNSSKTGEILSESSMENDDEATEVTDEPMEQD
ncbi:serine/threonine-protein phosphatase 4 regulatory subunit 2 isoform X1 [Pongo pygmaeus]|uniref:serine/threonine-protein phosphatase 4 regulatory subunit 2 isoform X1 n=2 Tax=Pongo abelii TaxID=9601 RepID=UPI0030053EDE